MGHVGVKEERLYHGSAKRGSELAMLSANGKPGSYMRLKSS